MKVDIYFNLHKQKLSVRSRERSNYGRVVAHADKVLLSDCRFVVSEAGRQRVLRTRRKNVHAVVRGTLAHPLGEFLETKEIKDLVDNGTLVTYNPYRFEKFVRVENFEPVEEASRVLIVGKHIIDCGV